MAKKNGKGNWDLEPQKSSAAQFLTYIASTGAGGRRTKSATRMRTSG